MILLFQFYILVASYVVFNFHSFGHAGRFSGTFLLVFSGVRTCRSQNYLYFLVKKTARKLPPLSVTQVLLLSLFSSADSRIWIAGSAIRPALRLLPPASSVKNRNLEKSYRGPKQPSGRIQNHILHKGRPCRDK